MLYKAIKQNLEHKRNLHSPFASPPPPLLLRGFQRNAVNEGKIVKEGLKDCPVLRSHLNNNTHYAGRIAIYLPTYLRFEKHAYFGTTAYGQNKF